MSCRERRLLDCKPKKPCGDTIKLSTEAITATEDLECLKTKKGDKLTTILSKISEYLCKLKDNVEEQGTFIIENIGEGARLFKGISTSGKRQFRTLKTDSPTELEIYEEGDEIKLKVNLPEQAVIEDVTCEGGKSLFEINADTEEVEGLRGLKSNTIGIQEEEGCLTLEIEVPEVKDESCENGMSLFETNTNTEKGFKGINSKSLALTSRDGCIWLETEIEENGGVPRYIVNNSYTGDEELGTEGKPFKEIKNAIIEFLGGGNFENPDNKGAYITIQRGKEPYSHSEKLNYNGLNMIQETGSIVNYTHEEGFLVDLDTMFTNEENEDTRFNYQINEGAKANITKASGFKNRGSKESESNPKVIKITGGGTITMIGVYGEERVMYSSNAENNTDYSQNPNTNITIEDSLTYGNDNRVVEVGGNATVIFRKGTVRSGEREVEPPNGGKLEAVKIIGGSITFNGTILKPEGINRENFVTLYDTAINTRVRVYDCLSEYPGEVENFFLNKGGNPNLDIVNFTSQGGNIENMFGNSDSGKWTKVKSVYGQYNAQNLTDNNTELIPGVINSIGSQLIETLEKFETRADAEAELEQGAKFINQNGDTSDNTNWTVGIIW